MGTHSTFDCSNHVDLLKMLPILIKAFLPDFLKFPLFFSQSTSALEIHPLSHSTSIGWDCVKLLFKRANKHPNTNPSYPIGWSGWPQVIGWLQFGHRNWNKCWRSIKQRQWRQPFSSFKFAFKLGALKLALVDFFHNLIKPLACFKNSRCSFGKEVKRTIEENVQKFPTSGIDHKGIFGDCNNRKNLLRCVRLHKKRSSLLLSRLLLSRLICKYFRLSSYSSLHPNWMNFKSCCILR